MNKLLLLRKWKGLLLKAGIHRILPSRQLSFLSHLSALSSWIQQHQKEGWSDFYNPSTEYTDREKLYAHLIASQNLSSQSIDYLEFGVAQGASFRYWISALEHPDCRFYGFDTFDGLPESWGHFKKGDMSNGNKPPVIDDSRHHFFQGLFQQTLFPFLKTYASDRRKIVHIDCDIYSGALYVLCMISPYLKKGDLILFDEFNVPMHEFKAFKEWTEAFYIEYEVLGAVHNYHHVALMIK